MKSIKRFAQRFWADEAGLELSEYAIMAGVIIVIVIAVIMSMGDHINTIFGRVDNALGQAATAAP